MYPTDMKKRRTFIYNHLHRHYPHYSRQDMVKKKENLIQSSDILLSLYLFS